MIRVDALALSGAVEVDGRSGLEALNTGDRIRARVVSVAADSRPLLMLAGTTVAASVPFAVVPGQSLDLQVLSTSPALRFGVVPPNLPAANGNGAGAGVSEASISGTGRLLGGLLGALPSAGLRELELPGSANDALLRDPPRLARALARSVGESGLFYENHQSQWVDGSRSLDSLRAEPQARFPVTLGAFDAAAGDGRPLASSAVPLHLQLVRQQLEVLGDRALAFHATVAPTVAIEWRTRIEEDGHGADSEEPGVWQTVIESDFASLHHLQGRLTLRGEHLSLVIRGEPAAIERMQSAVAQLAESLGSAGLQLDALRFVAEEAAGG